MHSSQFHIIIPPQDIADNPHCLDQIARGDENAFAWLYKNYGGRLYEYIYLVSGDKALSEDVVQQVFVKLWMNRQALTRIRNLNAYLYATAKNYLVNAHRRSRLERRLLTELGRGICSYTHTDPLMEKETKAMIHEAVRSLPPRQQLIYRLVREEEISRQQVSQALNLSPFTVKCTMQNALKALKHSINEKMGE